MRSRGAADRRNSAPIADAHTHSNPRHLLLIPLLALFLVHPLIVHGCSCGHDFDFHLLSWFEAATQIGHGNLHPHWVFTPAWDAGEPRFVFYPPLSWYLGALLGLAFTDLPRISEAAGWSAVPITITWIALTLAGLTMFRLARRYAGANAALVASAIYMANPYMLFTAFERTAYGELLAAAWMPLLLDAIFAERISVPGVAIPVALLWLTNAPAAVMGCYGLALLAIVRIGGIYTAKARKQRTTDNGQRQPHALGVTGSSLKIGAGTILGLALAAFYIVPAAYERRYVQSSLAIVGGMRIDANFLFARTGNGPDELLHDQVLRTASWIAILLLTATAAALIAVRLRKHSTPTIRALPVLPLAILTGIIAFMLTPLSAFIWHHTPELAFLQFPWRLLALLTPVLALALGAALQAIVSASAQRAWPTPRIILAAFVVVAILGIPAWHLFHQPCDPEDTAAARLALYHSNAGTEPTDEYTPATADNDQLQPDNRSWWLTNSMDADAPVVPGTTALRTAPMHLTINPSHPQLLVLNLRDYPAWSINLAHSGSAPKIVNARAQRNDGLITIRVPAGYSVIDLHYAQTADQTAGDAISLTAVVLLIAMIFRRKAHAAAPQAD